MKWVEFIKRPMAFCTVYVHEQSYTREIPSIVGYPLRRVVYYFDGHDTHFIHESSEIDGFGVAMRERVAAESGFLDRLLDNALLYQTQAVDFLSAAHGNTSRATLESELEFFTRYLANAVNIPHRLSWVFERVEDIAPHYVQKLSEIRSQSFFADIEKRILKTMREIIGDDSVDSTLIRPEEVFGSTPWPSREQLELRKHGWMLKVIDGERTFISGYPAHAEYAGLIETKANTSEVRGVVASPGKASGTVVIVAAKDDFSKITEGCIIITHMTTPEYIPYLNKVAAIVTDEGGSTCHAAIISRELKIPCVVGTTNATDIFKDGDMVEVDATHGIVRKI